MATSRALVAVAALAAVCALSARGVVGGAVCPSGTAQKEDNLFVFVSENYALTTDEQYTASGQACHDFCAGEATTLGWGGRPLVFKWFQLWYRNPFGQACYCDTAPCDESSQLFFETDASEFSFIRGNVKSSSNPSGEGDPHFVGYHGTRFDFNGQLDTPYCILSDAGVHMNALLQGYVHAPGATERVRRAAQESKGVRSWMKELGFVWTGAQQRQHSLRLVARPGPEARRGAGFLHAVELDGVAVAVPTLDNRTALSADGLSLQFVGSRSLDSHDVDHFVLSIPGRLSLALRLGPAEPGYQRKEDAEVHFDLLIRDFKASPAVHGVLGQTFRNTPRQLAKAARFRSLVKLLRGPVVADGPSGLGFLEGTVGDYAASDVLTPDCKVSSFVRA